jgi:uncharacterized protein (TIGR00369 family)
LAAFMADMNDYAAALNEHKDGWVSAMHMRFITATADEVVMEWQVGPEHLQAFGIVHGGVYAGAIETVASVGAALAATANGKTAVGLENSTSFVHAVASGTLRATAKPLTRGRTTQVWECVVTEENGRIAASGRVRLLCIDPGQVGTRS